MILFLVSLAAGMLTVLAPCILPLLPVIVGGSLTGDGRGVQLKKVLTIVLSLGASVIVFTLLLKVSTLFIDIPEYVWKWLSGGILVLLGTVTIFPSLWEGQFMAKLSARSNILLGKGDQKKSFWGDVIMGAALGPVFSTCSPTYFIVLATVLPAQPLVGIVYLLAYTVGLCTSLFVVAFIGQKIMGKLDVAANPHGWFKKILGIIFVIVGLAIISGFDKKFEFTLLSAGIFDVTKVEQGLLEYTHATRSTSVTPPTDVREAPVSTIDSTTPPVSPTSTPQEKSTAAVVAQKTIVATTPPPPRIKNKNLPVAPELVSPDGYINTDGKPVTLAQYRGKVVLLDVWTYSCINCQRTLPYVNAWYDKYKDQGLQVIGLHTPEFAFEKVQKNVEDAVQRFGIKYPVVLDNNFKTWNAYGNSYWPRKYLIDEDGYIIYDHIGEGAYDETEKAIQKALEARKNALNVSTTIPQTITAPPDAKSSGEGRVASSETYFGSARNVFLGNGTKGHAGVQTFTIPKDTEHDKLYLGGVWNVMSEYAENNDEARIRFGYTAKDVYFVGGSADGVDLDIYKDGVFQKTITVKTEQLYG